MERSRSAFTLHSVHVLVMVALCGALKVRNVHSVTVHAVHLLTCLLWLPCVADADIIFLPCDFYFLSFYSSPNLSLLEYRTQKIAVCAPSPNFVGLYLCNQGTYRQSEKKLLSSDIFSTCPHNMVNFGPLAAEIVLLVWGTPGNFSGFRVLAALLHGTLVVGVSQTLRH